VADWVIWLVVAGGLLLAELFTLTFVLGMFSVAAVVAAGAAALGLPLAGEIAVFVGASGVLWFLVKPLERAHRRQPALPTGVAALEGRHAVVVAEVGPHTGRVQIGGESWAARALAPGMVIPAGSNVSVAQVDGATLVVFPEEL
jgi:membrane protein implicated in regulation of membrane protease activity